MESRRCCPALAQVPKTVGRNSATPRACISFAGGDEADIRLILMNRAGQEPSGDESEGSRASDSCSNESLAASASSITSTSESL